MWIGWGVLICLLEVGKSLGGSRHFCLLSIKSSHRFLFKRVFSPPSFQGRSGAEITQQPSLVLPEGQTAQMKCVQTNGHNAMYWYQQDARQGLQLLFSFYNKELQHKGDVSQRFGAAQPQSNNSNLKISLLEQKDSAVYFCATSFDTAFQSDFLFLQKPHCLQRCQGATLLTTVCLACYIFEVTICVTLSTLLLPSCCL